MATLIVHHKVQNYSAWRKVFDDHDKARREFGSTGYQVFQSASDPNDITAITDWPSVDAAKAFATSDFSQGCNEERGCYLPARGDVPRRGLILSARYQARRSPIERRSWFPADCAHRFRV